MSLGKAVHIAVRNTRPGDIDGIIETCLETYPGSVPWSRAQLESHLRLFPEGQLVAVDDGNRVVGMAASLIILWNDYDIEDNWRDFTDHGMFTNHDPDNGRTLYGAEVMVRPSMQGHGIGKMLYQGRREIVRKLGLLRIRAGARLRGYCTYATEMSAEQYVTEVVHRKIFDPTLSFQLRQGFHVLAIVHSYLRNDPESLGWAAVIEWLNEDVATEADYQHRWIGEKD